jgi:Flp pilus assembly protein TadB
MYRSRAFVPVASLLVTCALWLLAPFILGRNIRSLELVLLAVVTLALFAFWRIRRLRTERMETESMRDSALW